MKLFPDLPADLGSLSADEITKAISDRQTTVRKIQANDAETVPADSFSAEDILEELAAGAEQIKQLRAELDGRAEAEAAFAAEVAKLSAEAGVDATAEADEGAGDEGAEGDDTGDGTDAGDGDEAAGDAEAQAEVAEPIAASAAKVIRRPLPQPTADREAVVVEDAAPAGFVASAGIDGVEAGRQLDKRGLGETIKAARRRLDVRAATMNVEAVVASAKWNAPEERILYRDQHAANAEKVQAVVPQGMSVEALTASGGLCAPLTPIYALPQISTEARPLRDSLPAFQADRGGITWAVPPSIADVTDAVGIVTAEEDGEGGTFAQKSCQTLDCQDFDSAEVAAIYHCLQWGNIGSRAWPERVAQFTDTVMAAWSRIAETNLLNLMKAASVQVTAAQATYGYGALSNFTSQILAAAAGYRSAYRMDPASRFRLAAPLWVRDLVLSDLINSQFDRFQLNYDGVDEFFTSRGVDPVWVIDGETSGGQVFDFQGAGALLGFPDSVKWFLYPEGTYIWVTNGTLELGIVRDSTLNAENDFQVFGEGFESLAKVGFASLEVTSVLCPSGATGGPASDLITCS